MHGRVNSAGQSCSNPAYSREKIIFRTDPWPALGRWALSPWNAYLVRVFLCAWGCNPWRPLQSRWDVSFHGRENQGPIWGRVCPVPRVRLWQIQSQNSGLQPTDFFPPSWAWVKTGKARHPGIPLEQGTGYCITNSGENLSGKQQEAFN